MKSATRFLAAALAAFAFNAAATPNSRDGNDLWIVPEESGWGLNCSTRATGCSDRCSSTGRTAARAGTRHPK